MECFLYNASCTSRYIPRRNPGEGSCFHSLAFIHVVEDAEDAEAPLCDGRANGRANGPCTPITSCPARKRSSGWRSPDSKNRCAGTRCCWTSPKTDMYAIVYIPPQPISSLPVPQSRLHAIPRHVLLSLQALFCGPPPRDIVTEAQLQGSIVAKALRVLPDPAQCLRRRARRGRAHVA